MTQQSKTSSYILPVGETDQKRLEILDEVYGSYSRTIFDKFLYKGQDIAVFGCGSGGSIDYIHQKIGNTGKILCVDASPEQINLAKRILTEKNVLNVEYQIQDVRDSRGQEEYDVVYCRFLLIHVENPKEAIKSMLTHVKKGGLIICDEYSAGYNWCYPESKLFDKITRIQQKINQFHGKKDNRYGEKLSYDMSDLGVELVHFDLNIPIFNSERKKQLMIMSWEAIMEKGKIREVVSDSELEEVISELRKYKDDKTMYQSGGLTFQYVGKKR